MRVIENSQPTRQGGLWLVEVRGAGSQPGNPQRQPQVGVLAERNLDCCGKRTWYYSRGAVTLTICKLNALLLVCSLVCVSSRG